MKDVLPGVLVIAAGVAFVGLFGWWEVTTWSECLKDHSWLYCIRTLHH
jgi:hypothetical protein